MTRKGGKPFGEKDAGEPKGIVILPSNELPAVLGTRRMLFNRLFLGYTLIQ